MDVVFTSYYTLDSPYQEAAVILRESLLRFGLMPDIRGRPHSGSWQANTHQKINHLLDVFRDYSDCAVVWIDADGEVIRFPKVFVNDMASRNYTFGAHIFKHGQRGELQRDELLGGTMWFGSGPLRTLFLEEVLELICDAPHRNYGEQVYIQEVHENWYETSIQPGWQFLDLPVGYCAIYDRLVAEPVIVHYQASRNLRHHMSGDRQGHLEAWQRRYKEARGLLCR